MKTRSLFLLAALGLPVHAETLIPKDKQAHLAAGVVIGLTAGYTAKQLGFKHPERWGFAAGVLAGVAKELYDKKHPKNHTCDPYDALATAAGATITFTVRW